MSHTIISLTATEACAAKSRMLEGNRPGLIGRGSMTPLVAFVLVLSLGSVTQAKPYKVDGAHTSVTFSVTVFGMRVGSAPVASASARAVWQDIHQ